MRVPLNLNVLDAHGVPRVMNLKEALQAFLDHRREVLLRAHRASASPRSRAAARSCAGQMIVYLNLDEVIRIIREDDDAKERMMKRWKLTEVQAEAILNMRLRALRRLEEIEIKKELAALAAEEKELTALLADDEAAMEGDRRRDRRAAQGIRRTTRSASAAPRSARRRRSSMVPVEALVEREPVTVLCSAKGWIRAAKGHGLALADIKYKEGDEAALRDRGRDHRQAAGLRHQRPLLHARRRQAAGRARPWRAAAADDRSRQRARRRAMMRYAPGAKLLLAASDGRGFVVPADEVLAQTRNGKQVLNLGDGAQARVCVPAEGDTGRGRRRQPQAAGLPARARCRRWRAAAASSCSATTTAGSPMPRSSRSADGLELAPGRTAPAPRPTCANWIGPARRQRPHRAARLPQDNRFG